jgi:hypothetical protein
VENRINLLVSIGQPSNGPSEALPSLYDKVVYALDCLVGDYNTNRAGAFIGKVYQRICCIPFEQQTVMQKKIMRMIIPELEIHMPELLDSNFYMQYKETLDSTESSKQSPNYMKGLK